MLLELARNFIAEPTLVLLLTRQGRAPRLVGVQPVVELPEREVTGERTVAALAQARARGVTLGRPREVSTKVEERVRALRAQGVS